MRLLWADLRKLRRRPASWVTFLLLIGLLALIIVLVTVASGRAEDPDAALAGTLFLTFPAAYEIVLGLIFGLGGLLAVSYGAAIAGSEWGWGTLKAAVARGEGRIRYTLVNYASVALFVWLGLVLAFLVGVLIAVAGATLGGVGLSGMGDRDALLGLPELFGRVGLALALHAAVGFAIATVARSQLAGIVVGIALFIVAPIAGIFAPDLIKWLPFQVATAFVGAGSALAAGGGGAGGGGGGNGGFGAQPVDGTTAFVMVVVWLVVALGVASLWTERTEISG